MKKKRKDELDLSEDDFLEVDSSEENNNSSKDVDQVDRDFIIVVESGCPVCGSDVKGNDYYKYFCSKCNLLFEKNDVIEDEFGKKPVSVRKMQLSDSEKDALENKRKELKDKILSTFSKQSKPVEVKTSVSEEVEDQDETSEDVAEHTKDAVFNESTAGILPESVSDDSVLDEAEPEGFEEVIDSETVSEAGSGGLDSIAKIVNADFSPVSAQAETEEVVQDNSALLDDSEESVVESEGSDFEEEPDPVGAVAASDVPIDKTRRESFGVEGAEKIIASAQSGKLHAGNCHFVNKIHPNNRIYFKDLASGEEAGYVLCVCLRKIIARQKMGLS